MEKATKFNKITST